MIRHRFPFVRCALVLLSVACASPTDPDGGRRRSGVESPTQTPMKTITASEGWDAATTYVRGPERNLDRVIHVAR